MIEDSNRVSHTVPLEWKIDGYDGNIPGDYNATGSFELPSGVVQANPPIDLEVSALIRVEDQEPQDPEDPEDLESLKVYFRLPSWDGIDVARIYGLTIWMLKSLML